MAAGRLRTGFGVWMVVGSLAAAGCGAGAGAATGAGAGDAADGVAGATSGGQARRPNIVFVLTDDLDSSLVRYMPQVRRMYRDGVGFGNYSVTDSLCCPSRASTFSGRFPHNTGVFTNVPPDGGFQVFHDRGEEKTTFATRLQRAGYHTAMMGKYLNGYRPGRPRAGHGYVPPGWNEWDVAGNGYPEYGYVLDHNGEPVRYGHRPKDYLTDVLAAKSTSFIRRQASAGNPFMLEVATFAPHGPATPAPRDRDDFPGLKAPRGPSFNEPDISDKPGWLRDHPRLTRKQIARIGRTYRRRARSVQAVDDMLAKLRATLRATGQAANTYVVFSSDNGFHLGQHRLAAGKQTAFDTDVHVPFVVTGPGVPAGRIVSAPAENIDLCPTFTALGGASPVNADGHSLAGLMHGRAPGPGWRDAALVEHHGPNTGRNDPDRQTRTAGNPPTYAALRTTTATYVEYENGGREYYDRRDDPYQLTNTYGSLPAGQRDRLHVTLARLRTCDGTAACDKAARLP